MPGQDTTLKLPQPAIFGQNPSVKISPVRCGSVSHELRRVRRPVGQKGVVFFFAKVLTIDMKHEGFLKQGYPQLIRFNGIIHYKH